jgi:hypothetical protein
MVRTGRSLPVLDDYAWGFKWICRGKARQESGHGAASRNWPTQPLRRVIRRLHFPPEVMSWSKTTGQ